MEFAKTKNNRAIKAASIPAMALPELREAVIKECKDGKRLIGFFAVQQEGMLYALLSDDNASQIMAGRAPLHGVTAYSSMTQEIPQAHMFERELWEETGIFPQGHPWLKPVRYSHNRADKKQTMDSYPFFTMEGAQAHEVAVGPVHAGVIEPGHFRFMCAGEEVHHLEIQLGYQHRGVEKLFENNGSKFMPHLAESIAGDTTAAHACAYCGAMEALAGCEVPHRAQAIRALAVELERAAVHTGDLAAIANDIAYLLGNAVFGVNRTTLINTSLMISGSRFGRGLVRPGGVLYDLGTEKAARVAGNAVAAFKNIERMAEQMFTSAGVLSRLQQTGVVETAMAKEAGLVGFAARASGLPLDSRVDLPYGAYNFFPVSKITMDSGDVFARAYLRYMEIRQSISLITEISENLPTGEVLRKTGPLAPDSLAVSITEGWRGEIVHAAITDEKGNIKRYKIKDPSFNNWYGLALAVRNNGISDFPLCNKSFNLSYCGNDL